MTGCGTYNGWAAHKRANQDPCEPCLDARRAYQRGLMATLTAEQRRERTQYQRAWRREHALATRWLIDAHRGEYLRLRTLARQQIEADAATDDHGTLGAEVKTAPGVLDTPTGGLADQTRKVID